MKKCLLIVLMFGWLVTACSEKTQSLEAFYTEEGIESVDKVVILDGSTGYTKTLTDIVQINEFLALVKDIEFSPQDNQEMRYGFLYVITLYDEEVQFNCSLSQIDDTYYDTNPDIYPIVDEYYKRLEIEEKGVW
ncbi:hypothetical protein AAGS61_08050 [Lysinibacillus sp. KU-BSD001]|uniref:hypothetical protein n=1 Tax=Lysinibacillus sp. KU-BSD001 TaxID=3141328 RepID=UPI0036EA1A79